MLFIIDMWQQVKLQDG